MRRRSRRILWKPSQGSFGRLIIEAERRRRHTACSKSRSVSYRRGAVPNVRTQESGFEQGLTVVGEWAKRNQEGHFYKHRRQYERAPQLAL